MLNVKKMLTKMLSLTPMFEYVGDANAIHWSSWTAADDVPFVSVVSTLPTGLFAVISLI